MTKKLMMTVFHTHSHFGICTTTTDYVSANLKEGEMMHYLAKDGHPRAPVTRRRRTGRVPGVDSWTQGASLVPDKNPSPGPGLQRVSQ